MSFHILGLGTAVPRHSIEQQSAMEAAKHFSTQTDEQRRILPVLYRRSGVKRRHSVLLESNREAADNRVLPIHPGSSENPSAAEYTPVISLSDESLTQSFYRPAKTSEDGGPTTAERMQRYERHAGDLATQAARNALNAAGVEPARITHLVTVSCTGFAAPGVDLELIRGLELTPSTARTHLGFMGCHGAINGLRVARAFAESHPQARVLMLAVELCSLHHQYGWQPDRIVANALFADGSAAIVGGRVSAESPSSRWQMTANGSLVLPDSQDAMSWRIGDHGFNMTLSATVPDVIRQSLKSWLAEWLASHNRSLDDIECWAIHPGGPRILTACGEALDLSPEQIKPSRDILARYGNMSSPTVLFILEELTRIGARGPCVALAFGPGLTIEAMLLESSR